MLSNHSLALTILFILCTFAQKRVLIIVDSGGQDNLWESVLSPGITAMLSADGGDRPWKQLLRNFMPYQGP